MSRLLLLALSLLLSVSSLAQTNESGDIFAKITTLINDMPGEGTDVFTLPSPTQATDWQALLADFFAENWTSAATKASALGYELIEFADNTNNDTYYLLTTQGTHHWGSYILNPDACRQELVLMSPHAKKDFNTGKQGGHIFKEIDAWLFMLTGTNRCNSISYSDCDGTTSICGSSESYRISDLAHDDESIWQVTTEYVFDNFSNTYFAQFHGFTKLSTDPYVIMSNGTRDTPSPDYLTSLKNELSTIDPVLTFKIAHIDLSWTRLIGFTNTNGRYINASTDICEDNATATSGRFMHLEQEKSRLRQDVGGWNKMGQALANAFVGNNCAPVVLPLSLQSFEGKVQEEKVLLSWEVEAAHQVSHFEVEWSTNGTDFEELEKVAYTSLQSYEWLHERPFEQNFYRLKIVDVDGAVSYSPIIEVAVLLGNTPFTIQQQANRLTLQFDEVQKGQLFIYDFQGKLQEIYSIQAETIVEIDKPLFQRYIYLYRTLGQVYSGTF